MLEDKTRRRFTASCSHRPDDDQDPESLRSQRAAVPQSMAMLRIIGVTSSLGRS